MDETTAVSGEEIQPATAAPEEASSEDFRDKYLRLLAEMENVRKRMQKEKEEMLRFSVESVIVDLLPAVDQLENALALQEQMSEETRNWARGFEMILNQLKEVFRDHGVAAFSAVGNLFDPHAHEAIEVEESSTHPEGLILHEYVRGYQSKERIIRAAKVKVATRCPPLHPAEEDSSAPQQPEKESMS